MKTDRCFGYFFIVYVLLFIGVALCVYGAEQPKGERPKGEWARVSVQTDTSTNIGTGYYLGGGIVTAEQSLARGSINMRAKVTFPCGKIYHGTIIFQDRRPDLCFIKLDNMPDISARYHLRQRTDRFYDKVVGRYHQRGRTARFYRRVV
jgi:hypothetical protein